jgi:hypothetical protein
MRFSLPLLLLFAIVCSVVDILLMIAIRQSLIYFGFKSYAFAISVSISMVLLEIVNFWRGFNTRGQTVGVGYLLMFFIAIPVLILVVNKDWLTFGLFFGFQVSFIRDVVSGRNWN